MSDKKQKYNWELLKQEFFASKFVEVKAFFRYKYQTYSSHIRDKTVGWTADKKRFIEDIVNQSIEFSKEKQAYEMSIALDDVLNELRFRISAKNKSNLSVKELEILWNIFMAMTGRSLKQGDMINNLMPYKPFDPDEVPPEKRKEIEEVMAIFNRKKDVK